LRIKRGSTRWVILIGSKAIKIARLNPTRLIRRLFECWRSRELTRKALRYGSNPVHGGLRYLLAGITANLQEARVWKEHPFYPLAPTTHSWLGLVNIQVRGQEITKDELHVEHPFVHRLRDAAPDDRADLMLADNFCRVNGRVRLVDYGGGLFVASLFSKARNTTSPVSFVHSRP
jgi:hypothetical protein